MINRVRTHLIRFARQQVGTTSFLNLIQEAELGLNLDITHEKSRLVEILAEISESEFHANRPLLSCLVKIKGAKGQGDNFFKMCERLGMGEWRQLKQDPDFVKTLRSECRDFWQNDENYSQFL
ncbi:hypothetical protein H8B15_07865 [Hymenobacter sp. BT507]|uniref:Uncharacterized protein n=1 Tax=Hymenobacter citatus TaxID=2763506 RepID=A0ABR7MIC2_9BACT|nr:hypothetical protein [Hymenobacter citatus]MBC6610835.1 hypothetical protein [Hymenobacter citatus]